MNKLNKDKMVDRALSSNKNSWKLAGWTFLCLVFLGLFLAPGEDKEFREQVRHEIIKPIDEEKLAVEDVGKVYFIAGILHLDTNTEKIKESIEKELGNNEEGKIEVVAFDDIFYIHSDYKETEEIIANIKYNLNKDYREALKNNKKIILFGHSWGGILAKTAISEFLADVKKISSEEDYTKIKGSIVLVTMATPHTLTYGSANIAKVSLEVPENIEDIKIFTFGGIFDVIVPVKFTHIQEAGKFAQNTFTREVSATHMMFLNSPRIHREIFDNIFK